MFNQIPEGSKRENDGDLVNDGEGVEMSGDMIELFAIFSVDIPPLFVRVSFLGEHLTGVLGLLGFFLGVTPPKFNLFGRSAIVAILELLGLATIPFFRDGKRIFGIHTLQLSGIINGFMNTLLYNKALRVPFIYFV